MNLLQPLKNNELGQLKNSPKKTQTEELLLRAQHQVDLENKSKGR
jgi:hypothetical protein